MACMNTAAFDHTERLASALNRRGNPLSVNAFLDILREMSDPASEALSAGEREFLLEATELTEEELSPQAQEAARFQIAEDRALAEQETRASALTTREVAQLLNRHDASIRRSKLSGDLYALPTSSGRTTLFPAWQFEGDQVVPGLKPILPLFPQYLHPLSIERFMTEGNSELDGRSPVAWLLAGGAVEAVASLVDELGYE